MTLDEARAALVALGWRECEATPCALGVHWLGGHALRANARGAAFTCSQGRRWRWAQIISP